MHAPPLDCRQELPSAAADSSQAAGSSAPPNTPDEPLLQSRLPSLDGLRFVAAVLIIAYHGGITAPTPDGVTFFFVLSGFLFAVLLDREFTATGTINLRNFYLRRAIRILPAFYAALLLTVVAKLLLHNPVNFSHAIASGLFAGNYYNALQGHPPSGFAHFWSLAVEEQFYLLWPLIVLLLARIGRRVLIGFLALSIVGICGWRTWLLWSGLASDAYVYNAFECRFDSLATGCLLGLLVTSSRLRRAIDRCAMTGLEPLAVIALLVWSTHQPNSLHHALGFTWDSLLMGLLLLQLIVLGRHPLWSWLNWRPVRYLGTLSYSAYLLHAWGLAVAAKCTGLPLIGRILVGLSVTMLLALIQYQLIERPVLRLRDRFRTTGDRRAIEPLPPEMRPGVV